MLEVVVVDALERLRDGERMVRVISDVRLSLGESSEGIARNGGVSGVTVP